MTASGLWEQVELAVWGTELGTKPHVAQSIPAKPDFALAA